MHDRPSEQGPARSRGPSLCADPLAIEPPRQTPPPARAACSPASTSLDPLETNPHRWAVTRYQRRVHARSWRARVRVLDALDQDPDGRFAKRVHRIHLCGAAPRLFLKPDGSMARTLIRCRDRLCPTCALVRNARGLERTQQIVQRMNSPRFLTLTNPGDRKSLAESLSELFQRNAALRRLKVWKDHVQGGLFVCEVTVNRKTGRWHPHLHVLIDGKYFPRDLLVNAWHHQLGGGKVLDIRKPHSTSDVLHYLAKYLNAFQRNAEWSNEEIREYAESMHGTRLIATFGNCHNLKIDEAPEPEHAQPGEPLCRIDDIDAAIREGDKEAIDAFNVLTVIAPQVCTLSDFFQRNAEECNQEINGDRWIRTLRTLRRIRDQMTLTRHAKFRAHEYGYDHVEHITSRAPPDSNALSPEREEDARKRAEQELIPF